MICYVVTETRAKYDEMDCHRIKQDLERLSGDLCLVLHYTQVTCAFVEQARPWAVCHSGGATPHTEYDVLEREDYRWLIRQSGIPQIGFCGGCQLIAEVFGGVVEPMRPLRPDEADLAPDYHPGAFKEWGVWPVHIVQGHPLFEGLESPLLVWEMHRSEIKRLPEEFRVLASTDECRVQAMVHEQMPLFGTQFHPERRQEGYPDGHRLLTNFFAIAREHAGR
ncbi:MAG: gamma-glutamyl-gamma-aminobutyrate hydrolase family protein [Armatimonadota bacterium]